MSDDNAVSELDHGYKGWSRELDTFNYLDEVRNGAKAPFVIEIPGIPGRAGTPLRAMYDLAKLDDAQRELVLDALLALCQMEYQACLTTMSQGLSALLTPPE